jgi:hypothetical protein
MAMDMYMMGFTSVTQKGAGCVALFFAEWALDTVSQGACTLAGGLRLLWLRLLLLWLRLPLIPPHRVFRYPPFPPAAAAGSLRLLFSTPGRLRRACVGAARWARLGPLPLALA